MDEASIEQIVYDVIKKEVDVEVQELEGFSLDINLFDEGLGLDSLDLLECITGLEESLDVIIPPEKVKQLKTIRGIVDTLKELIEEK